MKRHEDMRSLKIISIKLSVLSIIGLCLASCGPKTGIGIYKSYEVDKKHEYITIYSDSLITFRLNVSATTYENSIYIHLDNVKAVNQDLVFDSLSAHISYPVDSEKTANYFLKKYFIRLSRDSALTIAASNNQNPNIRGFRQKTNLGEYELDYFDKSNERIPKSIKEISIEIYVVYNLAEQNFVKKFKIDLLAKKHLWIQLIPKC